MKRWLGLIQNKFLTTALLFGAIPVLIVGGLSTAIFYRNLVASSEQRADSNLHIITSNFKQLTRQLERVSRKILTYQDITDSIEACYAADGTFMHVPAATQILIRENLNSVTVDAGFGVDIYLFSTDGAYITSISSRVQNVASSPLLGEQLVASSWFQAAVASNGKEVYYLSDVLNVYGSVCSTVKLLRSTVDQRPYAMAVINVDTKTYSSILPDDIFNAGLSYLLVNPDMKEHLFVGGSVIDDDGIALMIAQAEQMSEGFDGPPYSARYDMRSQIYALSYVDRGAVFWSEFGAVRATLLIAVAVALLSLAGSVVLSHTVTKPLDQLGTIIGETEKGQVISGVSFDNNEEVGRIGNAFLHMVDSNQRLQQKIISLSLMEKNAEIKALQSQINPHFLYNMLSSIYWLCTAKRADEAGKIAILLSDSFKYIMNNRDDMVPISMELNYVHQYLDIQNIRFSGKIHTEWSISPEIGNISILKLIIQPIVENALYHGLEPKTGDWLLKISGRLEDNDVVFIIQDNGVGMEDISLIYNGFGINNVIRRLKLKYGEPYGCEYKSAIGVGTTVVLRIPACQE